MPFAAICASHTPLMYRGAAADGTNDRVKAAFAGLAAFVREFQPDVVIQFSPDHFNGFFYDLMPPFCVGAGAVSIGDWGGGTGPLDVPEDTALALVDHLRADDFDIAVSYRMPVDHGFVQIWEAMFGSFRMAPIVPVFVNSIAPPLPTYRRVRRLGESVGRFAATLGKRVLFAASGGLSHDPPVPQIRNADPDLRARLIDNRNPSPEARAAREAGVHKAGALSAEGKGGILPLNPEWDRDFLAMLRDGKLDRADAIGTAHAIEVAGRAANESLCWVGAFAALAAAGDYRVEQEYYEAIPGWIAGFATIAAR